VIFKSDALYFYDVQCVEITINFRASPQLPPYKKSSNLSQPESPLMRHFRISRNTTTVHQSKSFCNEHHFTRCSLFNLNLKTPSEKKTSGATSKKPPMRQEPLGHLLSITSHLSATNILQQASFHTLLIVKFEPEDTFEEEDKWSYKQETLCEE
jgi:hypothetical protein